MKCCPTEKEHCCFYYIFTCKPEQLINKGAKYWVKAKIGTRFSNLVNRIKYSIA